MSALSFANSRLRSPLLLILVVAAASVATGWSLSLGLLLLAGLAVLILLLFPDWALMIFIGAMVLGNILPPLTLPVLGGVGLTWSNGLAVLAFAAGLLDQVRHGWRWRLNFSLILMLLFVGWTAVTLLWAVDLRDGLVRVMNWAILGMAYILLTNEMAESKNRDRTLRILAVLGWLLIVASFLAPGYVDETGRLRVVTSNPNALSSKLLLCSLGVLWIHKNEGASPLKIVGRVVYLLAVGIVVARAGSRGEMLALLLMVALVAWRFRAQALGFLPVLIVVLWFLFQGGMADILLARYDDPTLGGRVGLWEASWIIFRENPVVGVGVGETQEILGDTVDAMRRRSPHNAFLLVLLDTGLVGLLPYVGAILIPVWRFLLTVKRQAQPTLRSVPSYLWMLLAAFAAYAAAWFKSGAAQYDIAIYYLLALLVAFSAFHDQADQAVPRVGRA